MGKRSSDKGAQGEREARSLLNALLFGGDRVVDRKLGAGRAEDTGDLVGLTGFVVQVAWRANLGQVLRDKARECERQQVHAGEPFGVTLMKLPYAPGQPVEWRFVLTPEQFADIYAALADAYDW